MTDVEHISRAIRQNVSNGCTLKDAARTVKAQEPERCLRVMETIGSWTSSEPELAALQEVWT